MRRGRGVPPQSSRERRAYPESPYKSVGGPGRIWNALRYSMRGLAHAVRVESAFRQELIAAGILIPVALALALPALETVALIGSVVLVLIVELVNSSIEAAIDRISFDHHRLSGRAKDLGSAAVFLALLWCAFTWMLVAGPVVLERLGQLVTKTAISSATNAGSSNWAVSPSPTSSSTLSSMALPGIPDCTVWRPMSC